MKALKSQDVWGVLHKGATARLPSDSPAVFRQGQRVRAKVMNHSGHIRLPEYVQGCEGEIAADQGAFFFPDAHARGEKLAQRLYSVRFEGEELWGRSYSGSSSAVYVDLFESYLDAV